jgi:hypothetical protein
MPGFACIIQERQTPSQWRDMLADGRTQIGQKSFCNDSPEPRSTPPCLRDSV